MHTYTVEVLGNRPESSPTRINVEIDDPEAFLWTATATSEPLPGGRVLLPLRMLNGPTRGAVGVGIVSSDGRTITGRRAFRSLRPAA